MLAALVALTSLLAGEVAGRTPGHELLGKPVPEWQASEWLNSPPLKLEALRGKVVLVRWFTSTDCPYCSATAPALNRLDEELRARGLVVVGMYHHKLKTPMTAKKVKGWVNDYGFKFPVAVDRDWRTLHRWWLDGADRGFTSVTFLVDKHGLVRRIHPGGTMALGTEDFTAMRATIETLLAE